MAKRKRRVVRKPKPSSHKLPNPFMDIKPQRRKRSKLA